MKTIFFILGCVNTGGLVMKYMDPIFSEHFNIIADYDKGAALEYYFFMKVMQVGIRMTCFGRGFSVTGNTPYQTTIDIQRTKFLLQDSLVDAIKIDNNSTTVIKLIQGHDAIDFIVISKVLNNASQRMFLVRVANQHFFQHPECDRFDAVNTTIDKFENQTVTKYYIQKFHVEKNMHFMYSQPHLIGTWLIGSSGSGLVVNTLTPTS